MSSNRRTRREPTFHVLADGSEIVRVPLQRPGLFATVDRADFDHLMALGITGQWSLLSGSPGHEYVACWLANVSTPTGGTTSTIARLIMRGGTRKRVQYADGDRLNLRRRNLVVNSGHGRARLGRHLNNLEQAASALTEAAPVGPALGAASRPLEMPTPSSWFAGSWRQELSRAVQSWLRRSRAQAQTLPGGRETTPSDGIDHGHDRPWGRREAAWARFVAQQPDGAAAHA